jgi:hypothetical protein
MRKVLKAGAFVNLSRACPGQILFSAAKPNYMFKPTAELSLRLIQPCRRGGLTWRWAAFCDSSLGNEAFRVAVR